jgi:hypothetical protein
LNFYFNHLVYRKHTIKCVNDTNRIIRRVRHLFYCLKFKKQFREWLWERVRHPKIMLQYHPSRIEALLEQGIEICDLEDYLDIPVSKFP